MFNLLFRELRRKAFHLTGSLIPIGYYFVTRDIALILLSLLCAVLFLIEGMRLRGSIHIPELLLRPHEDRHAAGYLYFMVASLLSVLVFDKTVAIAALLMLAVGDTASGIAGAMMQKGTVRYDLRTAVKPLPVMIVMLISCTLVGILLFRMPPAPDMIPVSLQVYLAGALGATLGDALPVRLIGRPIDDNLLIPLMAGAAMTVVYGAS